jgi:prephenate dehydratase
MNAPSSPNGISLGQWYNARQQHEHPSGARRSAVPCADEAVQKIAIQGEPGSFSHEAALKFAPGACIVPCALSAEVFAALSQGAVDAIAVPIENSLAGSVLEHFDLLLAHDVRVERETLLRIRHNLIVLPGTQIDQIERVFSHPVALAQCRAYFGRHPQMESCAFYDTAGSVKQLMALQDPRAAAIASQSAARFYGAEILETSIEDNPENYTRFFLVRRAAETVADPAANKISLAFSCENRPGSLVAALNELAALGANMTKIESRPVHGKPWEYIFYVDCQYSAAEIPARILASLQPHCAMIQELGRYREAEALEADPRKEI